MFAHAFNLLWYSQHKWNTRCTTMCPHNRINSYYSLSVSPRPKPPTPISSISQPPSIHVFKWKPQLPHRQHRNHMCCPNGLRSIIRLFYQIILIYLCHMKGYLDYVDSWEFEVNLFGIHDDHDPTHNNHFLSNTTNKPHTTIWKQTTIAKTIENSFSRISWRR